MISSTDTIKGLEPLSKKKRNAFKNNDGVWRNLKYFIGSILMKGYEKIDLSLKHGPQEVLKNYVITHDKNNWRKPLTHIKIHTKDTLLHHYCILWLTLARQSSCHHCLGLSFPSTDIKCFTFYQAMHAPLNLCIELCWVMTSVTLCKHKQLQEVVQKPFLLCTE